MPWHHSYGPPPAILPIIGALLLLALIVGVVLWVRESRRDSATRATAPSPQSTVDPENVLAERFARGEIDDHEYRHRLTTLRQLELSDQADYG